jgi:hypothetical protein
MSEARSVKLLIGQHIQEVDHRQDLRNFQKFQDKSEVLCGAGHQQLGDSGSWVNWVDRLVLVPSVDLEQVTWVVGEVQPEPSLSP